MSETRAAMSHHRQPGAGAARLPVRELIAQRFTQVEDVVYVCLGVLLALGAGTLLASAGLDLGRSLLAGTLAGRIVGLLDQVLLILMIVEILYTVQVSFREHVLVPEPFLLVALIAVVRRVLVLTAEFGKLIDQGDSAFRNAMIELGLLTLMILALVASLVILRKRHPGGIAERA
ncbi:MAG TPA: phosphate-starvation-inducible PsiE family protein [Methylomirabilota bacterium]|nr:phosphate-starvation-inducible PsiE family protein [Methylomirabilota bacterium]